jgi:gamma-glutamyltranspeptidase/glutathione hydrolase
MNDLAWDFPYTSQRMPVLAATSSARRSRWPRLPACADLAAGGNAVDAALAAAITLTVVEPCMNGIGGDSFALVWDGSGCTASTPRADRRAAGRREHFDRLRRPCRCAAGTLSPSRGHVSGWRELSQRFGKLPFADLFESAVRYARDGWVVSPTSAASGRARSPSMQGHARLCRGVRPERPAPRPGELLHLSRPGRDAGGIARSKGEDFYRGPLARAIADHARATGGLMDEEDLADHRSDWVSRSRCLSRG